MVRSDTADEKQSDLWTLCGVIRRVVEAVVSLTGGRCIKIDGDMTIQL